MVPRWARRDPLSLSCWPYLPLPIPIPSTAGTSVSLTATPAAGCVFAGWRVDGNPDVAYFANPFTLTINSNRAVQATFAPRTAYSDVPAGDPAFEAIAQLTAAGIIRGFDAATCAQLRRAVPCFGPDQPTLRAQAAALITRAIGRDNEQWGNRFTDLAGVDANLQRNINTLAHYDIARGFSEAGCEARRLAYPCFLPFDNVARVQVISFITRAMVAEGIWVYQPDNDLGPACRTYTNVPRASGHCQDLATYTFYVGAVPGTTVGGVFPGYDQAGTRAFFAQALLQALRYDRVP